jgi:hypothetical protein
VSALNLKQQKSKFGKLEIEYKKAVGQPYPEVEIFQFL